MTVPIVEPPAPAPPAPPAPAPTPPVPAPPAKTFTQEEVTAIAAREKEEGRRSAAAQLATDLGITVEEAKTIITAHKATQDAQLTDAQKAQRASEESKAAFDLATETAKNETHKTLVERALLGAGVQPPDPAKPEEVEAASRLRLLVTAPVGSAIDVIEADVAKIKTAFPALFKKAPAPAGGRGNGDPGGRPPAPSGGEDAYQRGLDRAKKMTERNTAAYPTPVGSAPQQ